MGKSLKPNGDRRSVKALLDSHQVAENKTVAGADSRKWEPERILSRFAR